MSTESSVPAPAIPKENYHTCYSGTRHRKLRSTSRYEGIIWKDYKDSGESLGLHWASKAFYGFKGAEASYLRCEEGLFRQNVRQAMSAPVFRAGL